MTRHHNLLPGSQHFLPKCDASSSLRLYSTRADLPGNQVVNGPIMRKIFVARPTDVKILQVYSGELTFS
ncbi:hypothetical protein KIN20_022062 [Parelaphostrongylus tenuis]|uniref:Uncharacterized protein n=1 Tax=Parelaphostrongylus tenuis TaxID=148309 RepID=A0AAD5MPP7_PARTN|nr:hypothetical protein KIN20_022062 [Parelaphostrongylus tenuis]